MSLLPYLLYDERSIPRLFDQSFGLGLDPSDYLIMKPQRSSHSNYMRPWQEMQAALRDVGSSIKMDKDKFQVNLDVQHFAPEEINVKIANGQIIVEGKHEERKDEHGYISRQFVRKYSLPKDCNPDGVESKLSSDGVLTVVAPKKSDQLPGERTIPIAQTGPVRKEVKDSNKILTNEQQQDQKQDPKQK